MEDLNAAGGVYAVLNELAKKNLIHTDTMTVTGKTLGENIQGCINKNPDIIRPIDNPYSPTGGIAVLKGNLAPDRCVVKRSAVAAEMMQHRGPAKVFNSEEEAIAVIRAYHRRQILRCDPWGCHRSRFSGSRQRREHRLCTGRRYDFHRHPELYHHAGSFGRRTRKAEADHADSEERPSDWLSETVCKAGFFCG